MGRADTEGNYRTLNPREVRSKASAAPFRRRFFFTLANKCAVRRVTSFAIPWQFRA